MKKLISNYTITPWKAWEWYITLSDYSAWKPFLAEQLDTIVNVTKWLIVYDSKEDSNISNWISVSDYNKVVFNYLASVSVWDILQILIEESDLINPWVWAFAITPSDSTNLSSVPREIYVWVGGNIAVTFVEWGTVTLLNVPDGGRLPYRVNKVFSTWTTATNLIAII